MEERLFIYYNLILSFLILGNPHIIAEIFLNVDSWSRTDFI